MQPQVIAPFLFLREYDFFQQDNANTVTANNFVSALQNFLGQQIISRLLRSALLIELKPDYYCKHIW
jgi:hypothetical protein